MELELEVEVGGGSELLVEVWALVLGDDELTDRLGEVLELEVGDAVVLLVVGSELVLDVDAGSELLVEVCLLVLEDEGLPQFKREACREPSHYLVLGISSGRKAMGRTKGSFEAC